LFRGTEAKNGSRQGPPWEKDWLLRLTEPLVGSGTFLAASYDYGQRDGDTWPINGQKKWIAILHGATSRSSGRAISRQPKSKAFIVENKTTPGFTVEKIQNKIALKVVQNGLITMENCRVTEENRLQADQSFRDTARVLKMTRFMVAGRRQDAPWRLRKSVKYCQERLQFGKPIAHSRWCRTLLARMLANHHRFRSASWCACRSWTPKAR